MHLLPLSPGLPSPRRECRALYLSCHPGSSLQAPPSRPLPQSPVPARCGAKAWLCLLKLTNTGAAPRAPPLPTVLLPLGRPREGGRNEWRRNEKVREEKGNRAGHEAPGPAPRATESSLPPPPPLATARVPAAAHSGDRNAILGALRALLSPGLVPRLAEPKRLWFGGAETGRRAADSIPFCAVIFPSSPPCSPSLFLRTPAAPSEHGLQRLHVVRGSCPGLPGDLPLGSQAGSTCRSFLRQNEPTSFKPFPTCPGTIRQQYLQQQRLPQGNRQIAVLTRPQSLPRNISLLLFPHCSSISSL